MTVSRIEKIYFGRPVDTYSDVVLFQTLSHAIQSYFQQEVEIIDPSQEKHQRGYECYKDEVGYGMQYFFAEVLPYVDAGVFLAFFDGTYGAGVWKEALFLRDTGKPVYEIDRNGNITEFAFDDSKRLSVAETRAKLQR